MKEFLLIFRRENYSDETQKTPEEVQAFLQPWLDWIAGIAAQNKLVDPGSRLETGGRVVKSSVVTDGPYVEIKESVGGYCIIKADSIEEAVEIAKECPIHQVGGTVEVRAIVPNPSEHM